MIFSPHPDDEALMTSGIIEAALNEGIHPRVVIVTTGDYDGGNIGCAANR
jgi:LmbE family N-acetylglucosaminyl deacetylase